jgi:coproporphyrinogen III oxidase-like Fe-S oxidoreductase
MSDLARRALISKTYAQLNHELPIMFYEPLAQSKAGLWADWLADPRVSPALKKNLGLYIHVPYCTQICSFCYLEKRLLDSTVPQFMDRLLEEVSLFGPLFRGTRFSTLYLGGGTPGALTVTQLDRLFSRLREAFELNSLQEFSLETDLPSLTEEKLLCYQRHGLTRLSVGLQNLDPAVLAQNNRLHRFDFDRKMELLERHRFRDLNLDIIVGIPGGALESVGETVQRALALRPSRISLYTFNPYRDYDFDFRCDSTVDGLLNDRRTQMALAKGMVDAAEERGELTGRDNLQLDQTMRSHAPLLGLGPSANNRLPHHAYYKNPDSHRYLSEPEALSGWLSSGPDEELEFHIYNCLIRSLPVDLRHTRALFGRMPSEVHSFVQRRLGDAFLLRDGCLWPKEQDRRRLHLALLDGLDITQENIGGVSFPEILEGIDEERLLDILIGY